MSLGSSIPWRDAARPAPAYSGTLNQVTAPFVAPAVSLTTPSSPAPLVLLDVNLGSERALDFVTLARKQGFLGKILVVTAGITDAESVQLVQSGVSGILHKHRTAEDLCQAIRRVAAGEVFLEKDYLPAIFNTMDRTQAPRRVRLTERDKCVLRYVFQGLTNRDISEQLAISESGAKSALRQLFDKLGVRTRAQLVKIALEKYGDQL